MGGGWIVGTGVPKGECYLKVGLTSDQELGCRKRVRRVRQGGGWADWPKSGLGSCLDSA